MQHSHINSLYRLGVNCISSVMVGILSSSDHGFEPQLGQTRDYKIGISCFSAKQMVTADWLAQNENNVAEFGVHI